MVTPATQVLQPVGGSLARASLGVHVNLVYLPRFSYWIDMSIDDEDDEDLKLYSPSSTTVVQVA